MELFTVHRLAPLAKAAWQLSQEPTLHELLTAIADIEGQAAARAIEDAAASNAPYFHLQSTATLLRSAYEKYYVRGQNRASSPAEWIQVFFHSGKVAPARFNAALMALTIVYICRAVADEQQVELWRQRARQLFLDSYCQLVPPRAGTFVPSFGLPGSSNSLYVSPADEARHKAEIAKLQHAFDAADRDLKGR